MEYQFINRDISWLYFNERVLTEATKATLPVLERLRFLSIYSSNLDEFYRVRMPAITALGKLRENEQVLETVKAMINTQQQLFGRTLTGEIIPELLRNNIHLLYNEALPEILKEECRTYFLTQIAAFLQPVYLAQDNTFFPENNKIYLAVRVQRDGVTELAVVNIPSVELGRFRNIQAEGKQYIVTLDDILKEYIHLVFRNVTVAGCYSFKITRDAELDLEDEYKGDIAHLIEEQIVKRDFGFATRFLYDGAIPDEDLELIIATLKLNHANNVAGGRYHNLKDFADFPVKNDTLCYDRWPAVQYGPGGASLFRAIEQKDIIIHTPYQSYDVILRFFNEAALDADVFEIYITLYRVAGDSRIAQALISAAKSGKQVTVFVELKARFDEANNIRWAKKMKEAGVKIIYSIPGLKVHAKVALVKKREGDRTRYYGLFATGNFNESTARFYTDHILLTTHKGMLRELELLFIFLGKRRKPEPEDRMEPEHLLIAQFNLQQRFLELIEREIEWAQQGKPASIVIKLNNLEEEVLIKKLYDAAQAGVKINLIVRGICRLAPGIPGLSEGISIHRIVDRYLEHGRVFIFHNNGQEEMFMGSADWMNRNIYRRIEVCFPVYEEQIRAEIREIVNLQLQDNIAAVALNEQGHNISLAVEGPQVASQQAIYNLIKAR